MIQRAPPRCFCILVAMGECPQIYMIKARIAPRSGASAMLHTFAPRPAAAALAALRCSDGLRSSTLLIGWALTNRKRFVKMSANARASSAFAAAFLAALIILVAMGACLQTCMIKLCAAPLLRALASLHTFAPRPAAAALAALRCSVLMCGRSQMSARPDMRAYPSLRPLARCLIILIYYTAFCTQSDGSFISVPCHCHL